MVKEKRKWFTMADYEKGLCTKEGFPLPKGGETVSPPEPEVETPMEEEETETIDEVLDTIEENENGDSTTS